LRWLRERYHENPGLFVHWRLVQSWLTLVRWMGTWRSEWIETFTSGSVERQGWNSLAWPDLWLESNIHKTTYWMWFDWWDRCIKFWLAFHRPPLSGELLNCILLLHMNICCSEWKVLRG
jgi:hypothetical protein